MQAVVKASNVEQANEIEIQNNSGKVSEFEKTQNK